ncbi:MAG TPA: ABC transporter permease [Blastocatellia bacterium]|nr:ABC transporter permease [Blastocatellia bacterium]
MSAATPISGPSRRELEYGSEPRRVKVIRAPSLSPRAVWNNLSLLAEYKDLLYTLSAHRIKVRYKQSLLGIFWAVLQPLSLMLIYTIIFSFIMKMPSGDAPYALFVYAGILPWICFSSALTSATSSLTAHANLITKVYFPREILPLTYVLASLFDFFIASVVLGGLLFYYRAPLTWNVLYALPIMLALIVFALAMSLFFSALQARYRDIGFGVGLLLQLWMFATPVVYPLSLVPDRWRPYYLLNPMAGIVENFRRVTLQGAPPDLSSLGISALLAVVLLAGAYLFFKLTEATMADII